MPSVWRRAMVYLGLQDDEDYDYEGYEDVGGVDEGVPARAGAPSSSTAAGPAVRPLPRTEAGPATPARPAVIRTVAAPTSARVHVVEPAGFNDAQEVGDRLKANQPVILNLQGLGRDLQRRLIDFSSGLAYAVGGSMSRVADQVFLLTPSNVEVSQEEKERLQARGLYRA
ncbi:MAG: cell division protein SepF [Acidimicrobiia bacterium]|nr:cell division protein SepF [Acidimicrobiia bacterium]